MKTNQIARVAGLIGEPARTAMLIELMGGRALTATELARAARVGASTASAHLSQLLDAQLLEMTASGRHRYFRLASPEVARVIETLMQVAALSTPAPAARLVVGPRDAALRTARTCYDHLAGRLGVAFAQRLVAGGGLILDEVHCRLTDRGRSDLAELGIELPTRDGSKTQADPASCRPCMDWSERRFHIAGRLGSHICRCCMDRGWLRRRSDSRAVDITPAGRQVLQPWLGRDNWIDRADG